ncbi:MAG: hypothetical protein LBG65_07045, partial [Puniceicoccales bacterium]|jgi:hypothetical protein|nr:hypothetical protein [Puniceicoccales bacterium]
LSTPFFDSTHASFQNPFSRRFRATFHGRFFRHFPGVDPRVSTHAQTRLFSRTFRVLHESAGKAFVHGDVHRKIHDGLPRVPVSQIPAVLSELELILESLFSAAEDESRDASRNGEKIADSKHSFSNANDGVGRGAISGSAPRSSSASRTASSPARGTSAPSGSAADFSNSHPAKGAVVSPVLSAGRREIAESFFSHYRFLCERHPAYKKTALRFLEKLKQRAPVFQSLHPAWSAQISTIPDFPKSSPSRPPRPKNSR